MPLFHRDNPGTIANDGAKPQVLLLVTSGLFVGCVTRRVVKPDLHANTQNVCQSDSLEKENL